MKKLAPILLTLLIASALGIGCGALAEAVDSRLALPAAVLCTALVAVTLGLLLWHSKRLAQLSVILPLVSAGLLLGASMLDRAIVRARFAATPPPKGFGAGLAQAMTESFAGLPEQLLSALMAGLAGVIGLGLLIRRLWLNRSAAPR